MHLQNIVWHCSHWSIVFTVLCGKVSRTYNVTCRCHENVAIPTKIDVDSRRVTVESMTSTRSPSNIQYKCNGYATQCIVGSIHCDTWCWPGCHDGNQSNRLKTFGGKITPVEGNDISMQTYRWKKTMILRKYIHSDFMIVVSRPPRLESTQNNTHWKLVSSQLDRVCIISNKQKFHMKTNLLYRIFFTYLWIV